MAWHSRFFRGTTVRRTDTRLVRWTKVLDNLQCEPNAKNYNDPRPGNTLRQIMFKVAKALNRV